MSLELICNRGSKVELAQDLFEYSSMVDAEILLEMESRKAKYLDAVQHNIENKYDITPNEFRTNYFRYITGYEIAKQFINNRNLPWKGGYNE